MCGSISALSETREIPGKPNEGIGWRRYLTFAVVDRCWYDLIVMERSPRHQQTCSKSVNMSEVFYIVPCLSLSWPKRLRAYLYLYSFNESTRDFFQGIITFEQLWRTYTNHEYGWIWQMVWICLDVLFGLGDSLGFYGFFTLGHIDFRHLRTAKFSAKALSRFPGSKHSTAVLSFSWQLSENCWRMRLIFWKLPFVSVIR